MKRLVLPTDEATVLTAFGKSYEASMPELANSTRMSLSELRNSLARLEDRGFVITNGHFVQLTSEGVETQMRLRRNRSVFFFV